MSDKRDWQADLLIIKTYRKNRTTSINEQTIKGVPVVDVIEYWLQQYAAEKERADELQQALDNPRRNLLFELHNERAKAAAEKDQADYWREATRQGNIELEAAESREQKLKEAIERYISEDMYRDDAEPFFQQVLSTLYPKEATE
ncbi:hypothetical protein GRF59_14375 [Paenibacillus sp. HJL G12]|uniref:Uncharacterized protein n=1 Tax=Paenibacillus dendrobii TaxID=2691084 RepID=A0A7X3IJS6_9BACL|nr:hypothetical protein [Paenibacillus dendrobii]MWV44803.1 hypothetical protein [Paenibacillus dendrobii]